MPIKRNFSHLETLFPETQSTIPPKQKNALKGQKNAKKTIKAISKPDMFLTLLNQRFSYIWVAEYKFHPVRKWRMDFACPELRICIEIDGGIFVGGRHSRPIGMLKDNEKLNTAASMDWVVLKFTPQQKLKTETFELIETTIKARVQ